MGRRYKAILNYLNVNYRNIDLKTHKYSDLQNEVADKSYTNYIIATPTFTHFSWLTHIFENNPQARILCEKPITTKLLEMHMVAEYGLDLTMMLQYKHAGNNPNLSMGKDSVFDFYNHGQDGLLWDCTQIIALAKDRIILREESPIWNCILNGESKDIASMDIAYVWFMQSWLKGDNKQTIRELVSIHKKVDSLQNKVEYDGKYYSLNWHPSENE